MQIRRITEPDKILFTLTQTFRYLNCCCNVFLYSATSSLFRRELKEIFHCSKSSINHPKESETLLAAAVTRIRTPSSPILNSTTIDNNKADKKKRLVTTSPGKMTENPMDNVNLALTSSSPTNGHTVSFKT